MRLDRLLLSCKMTGNGLVKAVDDLFDASASLDVKVLAFVLSLFPLILTLLLQKLFQKYSLGPLIQVAKMFFIDGRRTSPLVTFAPPP